MALFDHVIESAKIGLRKPDPRIYQMMTDALGVDPKRCVYHDDLGGQLETRPRIGRDYHQVLNASQAVGELEAVTGLVLR
jgi:putative hydrolase of the HAD superfamily